MDFFDKYKALIITSLLCSILLLALYNFSLSSNNKKARELLVDLENFQIEKPVEEEPEEAKEISQTSPSLTQTHQAFNETQQARTENFDQQLQEIFEKNSASQLESSLDESMGTTGSFNFHQKKEAPKKRSDGEMATTNISAQSGSMDNSSISFSLIGRNAVIIPNPIYTCDRAGKIVVNINVNDRGNVISTSINKGSSSSSNDCLTQQALQYASQAVFSRQAGRPSQPGTITYNFKP